MGDMTKNFNRSEFACKCGCGYDGVQAILVAMCQVIRDAMGEPVRVNSACRCEKHNAKVGGVKNSYHTRGLACDLSCASGAVKLFEVIKKQFELGKLPRLVYCRLYRKKNFVHIDMGRKRMNRFAET